MWNEAALRFIGSKIRAKDKAQTRKEVQAKRAFLEG